MSREKFLISNTHASFDILCLRVVRICALHRIWFFAGHNFNVTVWSGVRSIPIPGVIIVWPIIGISVVVAPIPEDIFGNDRKWKENARVVVAIALTMVKREPFVALWCMVRLHFSNATWEVIELTRPLSPAPVTTWISLHMMMVNKFQDVRQSKIR